MTDNEWLTWLTLGTEEDKRTAEAMRWLEEGDWTCHTWDNCPMAFGGRALEEGDWNENDEEVDIQPEPGGPWDAPTADECLDMVGPAYRLWAENWRRKNEGGPTDGRK